MFPSRGDGPHSRERTFYLWMIAAAFAIVGLVALHMAITPAARAMPAAGTVCVSIETLSADVAARFPGQETVRLDGESAQNFMDAYNRKPPVSNLPATQVLILFHERHKITRIAFFRGGCAVATATVRIWFVREVLRRIRGSSI